MSLLLQFSLASGCYPTVGQSKHSSTNIPRRSWKKPHPQLCSLQGRIWPLSSNQAETPVLRSPLLAGQGILGKESSLGSGRGGVSHVGCPPEEKQVVKEFRRLCLDRACEQT